jgi:hypothetical protein
MKKSLLLFIVVILGILNLSHAAKVSCTSADKKIVVDPDRKKVVITKAGRPTSLKILHPANHGFQLFGQNTRAFETEGGFIVGIKDTKNESKKDLSVFKEGEVVAHFEACTEN